MFYNKTLIILIFRKFNFKINESIFIKKIIYLR